MEENVKKIILVTYADIRPYKHDAGMCNDYLNYISKIFYDSKDIMHVVVPYEGETRVECVNPVLVSEEEYARALDVVEKLEKTLHDIENKNKNE